MFFVDRVREMRQVGCTDNEIAHHLRQLYGCPQHVIDNAIEVADSLPDTKDTLTKTLQND